MDSPVKTAGRRRSDTGSELVGYPKLNPQVRSGLVVAILLVVADHLVDHEPQELLAEYGIQAGSHRQVAYPYDHPGRRGRGGPSGRLRSRFRECPPFPGELPADGATPGVGAAKPPQELESGAQNPKPRNTVNSAPPIAVQPGAPRSPADVRTADSPASAVYERWGYGPPV